MTIEMPKQKVDPDARTFSMVCPRCGAREIPSLEWRDGSYTGPVVDGVNWWHETDVRCRANWSALIGLFCGMFLAALVAVWVSGAIG